MENNFSKLLTRSGLTQSQFAHLIGCISGRPVERQRVWRWASGKVPPDAFALAFLKVWCEMTPADRKASIINRYWRD